MQSQPYKPRHNELTQWTGKTGIQAAIDTLQGEAARLREVARRSGTTAGLYKQRSTKLGKQLRVESRRGQHAPAPCPPPEP